MKEFEMYVCPECGEELEQGATCHDCNRKARLEDFDPFLPEPRSMGLFYDAGDERIGIVEG